MNSQQQQDAVRAKVIEVCPELMELSFGCKYLSLSVNGVPSEYDYEVKDLENGRHYYSKWPKVITGMENEYLRGCLERKDGVEILGHPIRLSHVLRAINKRLSPGMPSCLITSFGRLTVEMRTEGTSSKYIFEDWDLEKDDISLQSPETIDFLFKILCE